MKKNIFMIAWKGVKMKIYANSTPLCDGSVCVRQGSEEFQTWCFTVKQIILNLIDESKGFIFIV